MQRPESNIWITRIGGFAMSIAIAVSAWFLNQAWTKINTVETKIQAIEIHVATNTADKFTSSDWINAKTILDNERLSLDRRLMRQEETYTFVKESLIRMEALLKNHTEKEDIKNN